LAKKQLLRSRFSYTDDDLRKLKDDCLSQSDERIRKYNEYYDLIFNNTSKNTLYKHIKDIITLIYLPDNIIFDAVIDKEEKDTRAEERKLTDALKKRLAEKFISEGYDIEFYSWLFWSAVYGSYFLKCIIDGEKVYFKSVAPHDINVLYEDVNEIDKYQVILHTVRIPLRLARMKYPDAEITEVSAPQRSTDRFFEIVYTQNRAVPVKDEEKGFRDYVPQAKMVGGYAEIHEMWIWDDAVDDYIMVQFVGDRIYKYPNPFIPKQHPFIKICFNEIDGYFWGLSELHFLVNLYKKSNQQIDILDYLQDMLLNPPVIVYGLSGSIEVQEMQNKILKPGNVFEIVDPTAKFDFYLPKLDPAFALKMLEHYDNQFKEQSGIMGVLAGRPMPNVRSASYANILAQFASTQLKEKALKVEYILETFMTLWASVYTYVKKDYGMLINTPFRMDVFAHTSSPITALSYQDMLLTLAEIGIIPMEVLVDLLPLPKKDEIKKQLQLKALMGAVAEDEVKKK